MGPRTQVVYRSAVGSVAAAAMLFVTAHASWARQVVPRPLGADLQVVQPSTMQQHRERRNPNASITLRDALELALVQSPELAAYSWEIRAREALTLQAARRPNPVTDLTLEDLGSARAVGTDRVAQPQMTLQLSQLIELGGKRAAREMAASLDRDLAMWDFETARVSMFSRVTAAYLDVLADQETLALLGRTRTLAEQVERTVTLRVDAGVVSPIEQTRAGIALADSRINEQRARRALEASRTRLATLWAADVAAFTKAEGTLEMPDRFPTFDALRQLVSQNPDVARWATEIARRDATRAMEAARRVPDVTLSAGYRRFTAADVNAWVIGASVPLSLFDRNRFGTQAATDRAARAREEQRAAQAAVTGALAETYARLAGAHDEASALRSTVVPAARSAFERIEEGYRLGRFGFLEVLDAQRTLVAAESQHLRALTDWHKAVAEVERLTGAPLPNEPSAKP